MNPVSPLTLQQMKLLGALCGCKIEPHELFSRMVSISIRMHSVVSYTLEQPCENNHEAIITTIERLRRVR